MNQLTREEAIKRIRDIRRDEQTHHLRKPTSCGKWMAFNQDRVDGAVNEIMEIFDIKESEL